MCCFSQPVRSVTDTNIFARMGQGDWQYLVYQMKYDSEETNAMILPLPVALPATDEKTLEFISLKKNDDFFPELENGFPLEQVDSLALNSRGGAIMPTENAPKLVVHEVGDFEASFVPTVADFSRLDKRFQIPKESWDKIPRYADYGFAVFQLKQLRGEPHPMAFKFRSRMAKGDDRAVFFPTVHIHDGEVHHREHFDHTLYLQSQEFDAVCGDYQQRFQLVSDKNTGYVRSKWQAKQFCNIEDSKGIVDGDKLVHRLEMRGNYLNDDVVAQFSKLKGQKNASLGHPLGLPTASTAVTAGSIGAAGLAWFFSRRDRVSREQTKSKE